MTRDSYIGGHEFKYISARQLVIEIGFTIFSLAPFKANDGILLTKVRERIR
jgi:hypothetical protein